ncbi:MAG: hypothetical protein AAF402_01645 [Pseudomonadota bacterium]
MSAGSDGPSVTTVVVSGQIDQNTFFVQGIVMASIACNSGCSASRSSAFSGRAASRG